MKKAKLNTIKFGKWFFDHNEFKLLHRETSGYYYIDVNELTNEAEAIDWLKHLQHRISKRDVEDFVRIVRVLLCLDRSAFRKMSRGPATALDRVARSIVVDKIAAEWDSEEAVSQ